MQDLGFPIEDYDDVSEKRSTLSYVIINPCFDLKLEEGDIIYLIRPSPIKSKKTFMTRGSSIRASKVSLHKPTPPPKPKFKATINPVVITSDADEEDNKTLIEGDL
ncbi:potassium channel subfamily T member 2-like protein, partial [Leptotrombidium deliense]